MPYFSGALDMTGSQPKLGYEIVHTVTDYYDGPRGGIANYRGTPHFYECVFSEAKGNYSELFRLSPIDSETFELALEHWEIWKKWEAAFHSGQTPQSTHPCLPAEAERHNDLEQALRGRLRIDPENAITARGTFEVLGEPVMPKGVMRPLQVKWEPA
jgi:hypothetical protein